MATAYKAVKVSVVIPCRNEADYIDACLSSITSQQYPGEIEFLVAEGCSTDNTREKLEGWSQRDPRITIVDNPEGIVPTGLNRAISTASGDVIIRIDVHTEYDPDYIVSCVETLMETGAANVGGPWRARGHNLLQRVIALAFQSWFSSGGARSHDAGYEGAVDSVYLGCWRKETLTDIGLFDEELVRNQDDELNLRLTRAGQVVWQSPRIRSHYCPRSSLMSLFRQYFQYGYWKIRVIQKHRIPASWRHVLPLLALLTVMALGFAALFAHWPGVILALLLLSYVGLDVLVSVIVATRNRFPISMFALPFIFPIFHMAYAFGSLKGIVDFWLLRRGADARMTQITR